MSPEAMEPQERTAPPMGFVQRRLPWLVAAGALLLYCLTLPRWITFLGLPPLARATGWDWHPVLHAPLQFLLAYPCHWLPPDWQIIGLNLLAAICATLALALLARSVALLPHDRTRDQRAAGQGDGAVLSIRAAWLPPLLAVLVCGLQMTFWENAVVWTGEALDLLVFAYVVRCLLEFRIDRRDSWLLRMALAYGLGMTNNFAMIAFLPALVITLMWIKGLSLFKFRFFSRLVLCGLAGLSLYLLLPIWQNFSSLPDASFWDLLRPNLSYQKTSILGVRRAVVLVLSFTSLLPLLFMGIKWPASFGDISAAGNALTNLTTHVIHGAFLLACLYVAFDPGYSPRKLGAPNAFLPLYYLGALSVGYCSGYFLLIFGSTRLRAWQRPSGLRTALNRGIVGLVWAVAVAAPIGLVYINLPLVKANVGPALSQYARLVSKALPADGAVVLGDASLGQYSFQLYAVCAALKQRGTAQNYVLVETVSLPSPYYYRYLSRQYPKRWPQLPATVKPTDQVNPRTHLQVLENLRQGMPLCYLQPGFGSLCEKYYLKPRNLIFELRPCPTNALGGPTLSPEEINENVRFWQKLQDEDLKPMIQALKPSKTKRPPNYDSLLGIYYSRAVDYLGVEAQKSGDLQRAGECFALALALDPESPSALVNQEYTKNLRAGHPEAAKPSDEAQKRLNRYAGYYEMLLERDGPVDEPGFRNELAVALAAGRNFRQAAQQLLRVVSLTPTNTDARAGLARQCLRAGLSDLALNYVAEARATTNRLHTADRESLLQTEAWAYAARNDLPAAERVLREGQAKNPLSDAPYFTLAEIYLRLGRITNAMKVLEEQLKVQPENGNALNNYARFKILNNEFEAAVKLLDHAARLDPKNSRILMNRAISNLKIGKLDDAQRDYQTLESTLPAVPYTIHFGLFDIACRKKNFKTAIKYGQLYLEAAPSGTPEYKDVLERLKKAKKGSV